MRWPSRTTAVVLAVVVQAVLIGLAVAPRLSARLLGDEYRLTVAPVDPVDPFRGAYVTLHYPELLGEGMPPESGDVYIPLEPSGDVHRGGPPTRDRPAVGPYLACRYDGRLKCGIESLFLPEGKAASLERDLATDGGVATIKVDSRGNAIVVGVDPAPSS